MKVTDKVNKLAGRELEAHPQVRRRRAPEIKHGHGWPKGLTNE